MTTLVTTVREALRYKGKEGQLAWIGHRLAGLGTLLFFVLHIIDTSFVTFAPKEYANAIHLYQLLPFQIGEWLLVLAVLYHGLNGLRITLMDWFPKLWEHQRVMTLVVFGLTALIFAPVFVIMASHTLANLYGIHLF